MYIEAIFENGDRGPICKKPSDRGAWIVLDRKRNKMRVETGVTYIVEITGVARSGKLRFCKALATLEQAKADFLYIMELARTDKSNPVFATLNDLSAEALEHGESRVLTLKESALFEYLRSDGPSPLSQIVEALTDGRVYALRDHLETINDPGNGPKYRLLSKDKDVVYETVFADNDIDSALGEAIAQELAEALGIK